MSRMSKRTRFPNADPPKKYKGKTRELRLVNFSGPPRRPREASLSNASGHRNIHIPMHNPSQARKAWRQRSLIQANICIKRRTVLRGFEVLQAMKIIRNKATYTGSCKHVKWGVCELLPQKVSTHFKRYWFSQDSPNKVRAPRKLQGRWITRENNNVVTERSLSILIILSSYSRAVTKTIKSLFRGW